MSESQPPQIFRGMGPVIGGAVLVGALAAGVAFMRATPVTDRPVFNDQAPAPVEATVDYGHRLLTETPKLLGPDAADPEMRYTGARLACTSCHLDEGTELGTLGLAVAFPKYPRYSGRSASEGDIKDRINGCMRRSMNGKALPKDSAELIAMAAYIESLYEQNEATGQSARHPIDEPEAFAMPDRGADLKAGEKVYGERCAKCHAPDGLGVPASNNPTDGYVFPPLWGPDSFNDGAGMHRVLTAARFIKARMPLGDPGLTDGEAFDVAAYVNAQARPHMENLEKDYPDKTAKPVDSPYPPWVDEFPAEQHQFGPFRPIQDYYKGLKK